MSAQTLTAQTLTATATATSVHTAEYYNTLIDSAWLELERTQDVFTQEYILEEICDLEQLRDALPKPTRADMWSSLVKQIAEANNPEPEPEPTPATPAAAEDFDHLDRMTLLDMCNYLHISTDKPNSSWSLPNEELRIRLAQHENGCLHPSKRTDRHPKVVANMAPPTEYKPAYAHEPATTHVPADQAEILSRKSYRDLQAIAKQLGVKANGSKDTLIDRICDPTNPENMLKPTGKKGKKARAERNGKCVTVQAATKPAPTTTTAFTYRQAQQFIKWSKDNVNWDAPAKNCGWDNIRTNAASLMDSSHFQRLVQKKDVLKELCELFGMKPADLASAIKGLS